jgi:hypothetical protein
MTDETHDKLVLQAVHSLRHLGAGPEDIRAFVKRRSPQHGGEDDLAALGRLQKRGAVTRVGQLWFLAPGLEEQAFGPAFPPAWHSEDSWILLALLYENRKGGASTLDDLIGMAVTINHATPNLDELNGALNRLASAGLIEARGATYVVTDRARDLYAKVEGEFSAGMLEQWEGLHRLLTSPSRGVALEAVRWRIALTRAEWEAACARYWAGPDPSVQLAPSGRRRTLTRGRPRTLTRGRQRAPFRAVKLSRFARYGMIWTFSAMALVMLAVIAKPPVPNRLFVAIALSYLATGFGLLASGPVRYLVRRFRKKDARPGPLQGGLWDQELDGRGPDPSAEPG